jgi:hypothetical protein
MFILIFTSFLSPALRAHWKLWEYWKIQFTTVSTVSVGASPLVQNSIPREKRLDLEFPQSLKIVWEPKFCWSQPSGPE